MKLDKEQKRRLLELRNKLFERMEHIIEHRKRIIANLEVTSSPELAILLSILMGQYQIGSFMTVLQ